MANERASELLYDTASTLRLLDAELGELAPRRSSAAPAAPVAAAAPTTATAADTVLPMLPAMFVKAMGEVQALLESIRTGREHIRAATTDRLVHTSEKLDEVSSATGKAALDIMHALERAIAKVDELDSDAVVADPVRGRTIRSEVKDELFVVIGHMQFQDITSQQIMHVQSLLAEMEGRLIEIANLFDQHASDASGQAVTTSRVSRSALRAVAFDENATLHGAGDRQALADALVGKGLAGA
jgi:chemotaxis regulatin CheY-phosphate phosphatase CheZ